MIAIVSLLTIIIAGMPGTTYAQTLEPIVAPETTQEPVSVEQEALCIKYDGVSLNVANDADKRLQDDQKKQTQQDATRVLLRSNLDSKILDVRSKWEQEKQTFYDRLYGKAITEDQKIAVKKFESIVDSALANRQAAIDKVRLEYRKKIDTMLAKKKENLASALPILKESVTAVSAEAKNSCMQVSANIPIITSILRGQLIAAQKAFKTSVLGPEATDKELLKINEERLNDVKKVDNTFKNLEESARRELRGLLGDNV